MPVTPIARSQWPLVIGGTSVLLALLAWSSPVAAQSNLPAAVQPGVWYWLGFGLVVLVLAILILPAIVRWQRGLRRQLYRLELTHLGNVRSRYEIRADDPGNGLAFEFLLNGARLPERVAPVSDSGPAAGPATPAAPAEPPAAGLAPMGSAPSTGGGIRQTVDAVGGGSGVLSDLLYSLSLILPGTAGRSLVEMSNRLRSAQWTAQRVEQIPRQVSRLKPGKSTPAFTPSASSPAAPRPYIPATAVETWSQTPELEPNQVLTLHLVIRPLNLYQSQAYSISLVSRPVGHPEATVVEESVVQMEGLTHFERFGPFLGFLALVLILLIIFLSLW